MKHKAYPVLVAVLALVLIAFVLPSAARAAESYPLWVGGTQVTSDNAADVFGDGKVKFDPEACELILKDYTYKQKGYCFQVTNDDGSVSDGYACIYYDGAALTVTLKGANSVQQAGTTAAICRSAVYATGDLTIEGSGSLTANAYNTYHANCRSYGIYSRGSLTFEGSGSVTAKCGQMEAKDAVSCGIYCGATLTFSGTGSVTAEGGTASVKDCQSFGIHSGGMTVDGTGSVTATGGLTETKSSSCGIDVSSLTIKSGTVTATGGKAPSGSTGINAVTVTVENGSLTAVGGEVTNDGGISTGVHDAYTTVTGGTFIAVGGKAGDSYGLRSTYGPALSGGTVYVQGGEAVKGVSAGMRVMSDHYGKNHYRIEIGDGANVTAAGGSAEGDSYGILTTKDDDIICGITVTGGSLTAKGGASASGSSSGIWCTNDLIVEGGSLDASGTDYGIYAMEGIGVDGGAVTAAGGDTKGSPTHGIYCENGALTVSGGEVTARGGKSTGSSSCGVYTAKDNVVVSGGTLTAEGGKANTYSYGVYSQRALRVEGGTLVTAGVDYGAYAKTGITVSDGNAEAYGGDAADRTSCGLYCQTGPITLSGGSAAAYGGDVTGTGSSYGIWTAESDVVVSGGSVSAGGGAREDGGSFGIRCGGSLRVSDSALQAYGYDGCGVCAGKDVTVSGGELYAYGGELAEDAAIRAEDGAVTISGCEMTVYAAGTGGGIVADSASKGDVVIGGDDTTVSVEGGAYGVRAARDLTITGGTVTADGSVSGLSANGDLRLAGGIVTAQSAMGTGLRATGALAIEYPTAKLEAKGGTMAVNGGSVAIGEGMKITAPAGGVVSADGNSIAASADDTAPAKAVAIAPGLYTITVAAAENGTVTADKTTAFYTDTITVTTAPAPCWALDSLTWTDGASRTEAITGGSFSMPGADITVTAVFKLAHTLTKHAEVPATCTSDGVKEYYACSVCGKLFSDASGTKEIAAPETIPATGHSFGAWIVTTPAGCETPGEETRTCAGCGKTETQPVSATGHSFGAWIVTTPAGCETPGEETRTCAGCGKTETHPIEATGHLWGAWAVTTDPGCETGGVETRVCANDSTHTETRPVDALGHDWGAWTETKPATETEEGEETRTCTRCGGTEKRAIPVLIHEHSMTAVEALAPTCTEAGHTAYYKCAGCGRLFADEAGAEELTEAKVLLPAAGHSYTKEVTEPTCTAGGYTTHTCAVCGDSYVDEIVPAKGHGPVTHTAAKEPTETEPGNIEYWKCGTCGRLFADEACTEELSDVVLPAAGVWYGDVNGDGRRTPLDAVLVLRYLVGTHELTGDALARADADRDGKVTAADAAWILGHLG